MPRMFYASYAFLSDEAERGFIQGTRKLQQTDWISGENLWLVDVINFGGPLLRILQQMKRQHPGKRVKFRRNYDNGERRYASVAA